MQTLTELLVSILLVFQSLLGLPSVDTAQPPRESETATVLRVIDGDTIIVDLDGVEERVRYIGIDTPERARDGKSECWAEEATAENEAWVEGKKVQLIPDISDRDTYGRLLRYVYVDDTFVQAKLIEAGVAKAIRIEPDTAEYRTLKDLETNARTEEKGLWGGCIK